MTAPGAWMNALQRGLCQWCTAAGSQVVRGVQVQRLRPRCPLLLTSGATPGPFYHSHPHVASEFDHLRFDMASQVWYNAETLRSIADSVSEAELPFAFSGRRDFARAPLLVHWVSNRGAGFAANARECEEAAASAFMEHGLDRAETLGLFETGGNVSDRRFLLETFAMFGLHGEPLGPTATTVRLELRSLFDSVDGATYTVGEKRYFMPYVPGYVVCGGADLALFTVSAASGEPTAPADGSLQVNAAVTKLCGVLSALGATFDDVVLLWNRVENLDEHEDAVLMTRARRGLTRPLAEAVLEVAPSDPNGAASDGSQVALEYIVAAQVPPRLPGRGVGAASEASTPPPPPPTG
mmetsp:Transcript_159869/g.489046  ORF Transcript_159869/g.489046 Transcript_159869/m.489046 type:complete len:352 (+) Transcript_159869:69-1124(+)